MRSQEKDVSHRWSIILAGGEAERTRSFIEQWLGYHRPKQFCSFVGTRSMLQHTWDRADELTLPGQKITVVANHHVGEMFQQMRGASYGQIIYQPHNCGTAAGIFLPLTFIQKWDPQATVVLYPSDHFVFPEFRFVRIVGNLIRAAELFGDRLILLGASPTGVELDYGWIETTLPLGSICGSQILQVGAFLEKPDVGRARAAMQAGGLWNTLVMAFKVETLWEIGWQCLPEVMQRFDYLGQAIGTSLQEQVLRMIYEDMPQRNFSSDLLENIPERVGVLKMKDVLWSDWGHPSRILEMLQVIKKEPTFSSPSNEPALSGKKM